MCIRDRYKGGRLQNKHQKPSKSTNVYIKLLIKLYKFMSRRTDSKFNSTILKRLNFSRRNRYPVSLSRIIKSIHKKENLQRTIVVCSTITNDVRLLEIPKLTVCALRFTEAARKRILEKGGKCLSFDQLALQYPTGSKCILLRGSQDREAKRHFGPAPGAKGSHTKPYVRGKGRKFEMGTGRR
eukprot:TRINITY_DN1906_c0_g1_i1.p1 TRINITY_DN1906_c0_g1~~TRINITY_DN1906_c0_g1_i1.p1  ORF type:complete len:183 (-),score=19.02 TRINITY_DN1906_c0_g1_i1:214-762(-)